MVELYVLDAEGEPVSKEQVGLRFDANVLADLEQRFPETVGDRQEERTRELEGGDTMTYMESVEQGVTLQGLAAWNWLLQTQPNTTARATLALLLGESDERAVGDRMIETETQRYLASIGAAFAIANGVDPTAALKALDQIEVQQAAITAMLNRESGGSPDDAKSPPSTVTPGRDGSTDGATPGDRLTSSGD